MNFRMNLAILQKLLKKNLCIKSYSIFSPFDLLKFRNVGLYVSTQKCFAPNGDGFILECKCGIWFVSYSERGTKNILYSSENESNACKWLYHYLQKMRIVK